MPLILTQRADSARVPVFCHDAGHGDRTNDPDELVLEHSARELLPDHQVHVILQCDNEVKTEKDCSGVTEQKDKSVLEPNSIV